MDYNILTTENTILNLKELNQLIVQAIKQGDDYVVIKKIPTHQLSKKLISKLSYNESLFAGFKANQFKKNHIILQLIQNQEIIEMYNVLKNTKKISIYTLFLLLERTRIK